MGLVGLVAAVVGAMITAQTLWRLRQLTCPRCGGVGSLAMVRAGDGGGPAAPPVLVGAWHCRACGRPLPQRGRDQRMVSATRLLALVRSVAGAIPAAR